MAIFLRTRMEMRLPMRLLCIFACGHTAMSRPGPHSLGRVPGFSPPPRILENEPGPTGPEDEDGPEPEDEGVPRALQWGWGRSRWQPRRPQQQQTQQRPQSPQRQPQQQSQECRSKRSPQTCTGNCVWQWSGTVWDSCKAQGSSPTQRPPSSASTRPPRVSSPTQRPQLPAPTRPPTVTSPPQTGNPSSTDQCDRAKPGKSSDCATYGPQYPCCSKHGFCGSGADFGCPGSTAPTNNSNGGGVGSPNGGGGGGWTSGDKATYHEQYSASFALTGVTCSDGANGLITKFGYTTFQEMWPYVVSRFPSWNSLKCGECYEVKNPANGKSVNVTVLDLADTWDLSSPAFKEISVSGTISEGIFPVDYRKVASSKCRGNKR